MEVMVKATAAPRVICRHCAGDVYETVIDLGASPPSNAYLTAASLSAPELYFPLRVVVCTTCWLIQTQDFHRMDELFNDSYAYFSSTSQSWLQHAAAYAAMITERLALGHDSFVVEIAANDGYLLKNFVAAKIPCLGIEPTESTASAAELMDIPVAREFFSAAMARRLADEGKRADLIIGNNVYAHVPDINDFSAGLKTLLKPDGVITLEFPHAMRLIEHAQFDTIYHEHFSYLSLHAVRNIFRSVGLRIWDVEELSTHGGSLRVYGCHLEHERRESASVARLLAEEVQRGMLDASSYSTFQQRADKSKNDALAFLIEQKRLGKTVAGYGAAAKGNTLINYAGIKPDTLAYVCDAAASKQGKYLPGSRIPIFHPEEIKKRRPDFVFILPWNIAEEVMSLHGYIVEWGGKFVVAAPTLRILPAGGCEIQ